MRRIFLILISLGLMLAFNGCSESNGSSTGPDDDNTTGSYLSFESWSGSEPINWTTSNVPNLYSNVTKSDDAQAGSYAAKCEIISYQGVPLNASITSGDVTMPYFEIDQAVSKVKFYYKFFPQIQGESILVQISLYGDYPSGLLGFESFKIDQAASSYTMYTVEMAPTASTPKKIQISFASVGTQIGTYFIIDNFSWE